ncbi:hypothetical protein FACS1894184_07940 [Clostridia bacterium]|nr:hypothetical protein FACS1894184_07940 [Clostridia bacterium]
MRKRVIAMACMVLTSLMIWKLPDVLGQYPVNREGTIRNRGWQGVLRVWVCQDWSSGAMGWVTKQAAAFEKSHKGVRISIRRVTQGAWLADGAVLPDALIFSAGMVNEPRELLAPFAKPEGFLHEAARAGEWAGEQYALPLALGGYAVLVNEAMWPEGAPLAEPAAVKKQVRYAIQSPGGGALAALAGWDEGVEAARRLSRPEGFGVVTADAAYGTFVGENVAAQVGTVDQTRRFGALVAAGRGFEYRVETVLSGFCDQVLMIGKIDGYSDRKRDAVSEEFVWWVTGKAAQDTLMGAGLIPVREDAARAGDAMPTMKALQERYQTELATPNAFGWAAVKGEFFERALHAVLTDATNFRDAIEKVR